MGRMSFILIKNEEAGAGGSEENEMDSLYIIIPAYNEEENILRVLEGWYPVVERHSGEGRSRLVVVDDGSRDGTRRILEEYAAEHPLLVPLTKKNGGHGAAVLYGYRYALRHGADYIFQTDSDGQTLPEEFEPFWAKRKAYDMVIGSRKKRQDGISRVVVTRMLRLAVRFCFQVRVEDANTPYRLMRAEPLAENLSLIPEDFSLSNVAITAVYVKKGLSVKFLPITFRPRQGGVNSINIPKILRIGRQAVKDFRAISRKVTDEKHS